jgi:hypothetical protein
LNQILLVFLIAGTAIAIARRSRTMIACAVVVFGFALVSTLLIGDPARYMSAHAGPLMVLLAVYGFRRLGRMKGLVALSWLIALIAAHAVYFVVKAQVT